MFLRSVAVMDGQGNVIHLSPIETKEHDGAKKLTLFEFWSRECWCEVVVGWRPTTWRLELLRSYYVKADDSINIRVVETFVHLCGQIGGGLGPGAFEENGVFRG
jgi:hypothetical protein